MEATASSWPRDALTNKMQNQGRVIQCHNFIKSLCEVYMCVHICTYVCACMWRPEVMLGSFLQFLSSLFIFFIYAFEKEKGEEEERRDIFLTPELTDSASLAGYPPQRTFLNSASQSWDSRCISHSDCFISIEDPNSGCHSCTVNTLLDDNSPSCFHSRKLKFLLYSE
jgi:hypothetical protein